MDSAAPAPSTSRGMRGTGYVVSALPVAMLLFSAIGKFSRSQQLVEGMAHIGWPDRLAPTLGIVELISTVFYVIPQTSVLGAVLLTGYMGGAIATHARIGEQFIFQAIIGILLWLGLFLRDSRIRAVLPLRR